jgi:farnesyl diphosphate synthase
MNWNEAFQRDFEGFFSSRSGPKSRLNEAITYALRSPGKRLRARFASEAGKLAGLDSKTTEAFSYAIELVHLFSLIHDDLPCMDDDDFRRGEPTVHKKFDEATALLAGDALLNLAFDAFSECAFAASKVDFVKALRFFTDAIGSKGMIGGQSQELELGSNLTQEALLQIQDLKTGALFRAALLIPFILAGTSEDDQIYQSIATYASDFGFAFQIADDLEDEVQDQNAKVKNILSILGRDAAKKLARERLTKTRISESFSATELLLKKLV